MKAFWFAFMRFGNLRLRKLELITTLPYRRYTYDLYSVPPKCTTLENAQLGLGFAHTKKPRSHKNCMAILGIYALCYKRKTLPVKTQYRRIMTNGK